jgi:regulator of sigma E protease
MLAILAPIFVFGLVIFVHELGHFLAAKSVGVYTPRFSIGFGPALWRKRRGETEYVLAAFPLGGYVRMASRLDEATAGLEGGSEESLAEKMKESKDWDPEAMIPFGPKPVPEHRWFESKPLWARLYILLAGVTMNFILGVVVAIGLAFHFGDVVVPTRVVGAVRPINGQPLLASAVRVGDTLVAVNGDSVRTWNQAMRAVVRSKGQVALKTSRGEVTVPLDGPGQPTGEDVALAIDYQLPAVIGDVLPGEAAAKAGLQAGDSVITVDGRPVRTWADMVAIVANSADKPIVFEYSRAGTVQRQSVTPRPLDGVNPETGARGPVGKIGAYQPDVTVREPVRLGRAIESGTRNAWIMATSIVGTVRDLVTRRVSVDQLGGPIAITRASVVAARSGAENLFYLIALLSINVGILNLLPIPILDGGQVLINVLESARGKAFSLRTREYILRGGLFFILILFVLVMFNDTRALFR